MKAKFLKRTESVKSDKVVVWMEVEGKEVFALEKEQTYEIALCESKLPNMAPSPKELLLQAQALISQASEGIPGPTLREVALACDTSEGDRCVDCFAWEKVNPVGISILKGVCMNTMSPHLDEITPLYHWCSYWRPRNEEDKEEGNQEAEVRPGVDGEEQGNSSVHEQNGD